ncbi:sn-glycerol 3-phosphate transport system ATP-binding protein [Terribacillus halophilus]|uniref:sn-glycerol 3-phosphate transport system ATP-binding protein n=1 Tax=Terribacillus halophilus TaxID=361279 RepID=A0A1G6QJ19_9BACI|nr:ABC transporter ATP-binding protein [Terribacillus halophilus]SDC92161.1 sn-glycerol 3-phosphate transport system ATP-binding protein [Terribacillus halophilus]
MKEIRFEHVSKSYGKTEVVKDLNLTIKEGERLILLGPSGCGKSTTLRMIAGLEDVTSGSIYMDKQKVNDVPSGKRNVAMVFQNYALYPHMKVIDNITYGLKVKKMSADEIKHRTDAALEMLQLKQYKDRLPKDLSGGQRQRVALARAVVKQGDCFLLDEPLSNLDAQLRVSARKELVKIHETFKQTLVYVTHDQTEAMTVGDRIALMYQGKLQMVDTPDNVYHRPANIFTAKFIGSPPMNVVDADFQQDKLLFNKQALQLSPEWSRFIQETGATELAFGTRPEHIHLSKIPLDNSITGQVKQVENHGSSYGVYLDVEGQEWIAMSETKNWLPNETVHIEIRMDKIHLFDKETTNSIGYPKNFYGE